MNWVVDIVLFVVVGIAAFIGYKKGVVKMLLSFLVIVLSLGISLAAASPLAAASYEWFFAQSVSQTVDASLEAATADTVERTVEEFLNSGDSSFGAKGLLGFDTSQVMQQIQGQSTEQIAHLLKEEVIRPPMVLLLQCILFLLLFFILWILLWLISKALCQTAKTPVIRGANKVFGAVAGLAAGLVICGGITRLLDFMIPLNPNGVLGITQQVKDTTVFYQLLSEILQR